MHIPGRLELANSEIQDSIGTNTVANGSIHTNGNGWCSDVIFTNIGDEAASAVIQLGNIVPSVMVPLISGFGTSGHLMYR
jgi:hypothetical protein